MLRLEEAIAIGNHREAARLAKEVSKVRVIIFTFFVRIILAAAVAQW